MAYNKAIRRCDECNMVFEPEAREELQPVCPYCVITQSYGLSAMEAQGGTFILNLFSMMPDAEVQQLYDGVWHAPKPRRIKLRVRKPNGQRKPTRIKLRACSG